MAGAETGGPEDAEWRTADVQPECHDMEGVARSSGAAVAKRMPESKAAARWYAAPRCIEADRQDGQRYASGRHGVADSAWHDMDAPLYDAAQRGMTGYASVRACVCVSACVRANVRKCVARAPVGMCVRA